VKSDSRPVMALSLILIILIGFLDYITSIELSFSIFYIFPIYLISVHQASRLPTIIFCSFFATILWFYSEFSTREYSSIFFPIWNAFVRLGIFIVIGILLYNLKEKDKRLKTMNNDLRVLNEEKNKFIGIAAHDLRNPMSNISALTDLLINQYKKEFHPHMLEMLDLIRNLSNHSLTVLKNLLDVAKIEAGKVEIQLIRQDYVSFLNKQVKLNQILAERKNIGIKVYLEFQEIEAEFDNYYLSEVVDNLLSNAIKFSEKDGEITVKTSIRNQTIVTEVIDQGKGIPEEEQKLLFRYFQKASTRPTSGEAGAGLGLAIVRDIVGLHGGEVGVISAPDMGSNFFFTLPLTRDP
jgi:signal transduction histidine kinase